MTGDQCDQTFGCVRASNYSPCWHPCLGIFFMCGRIYAHQPTGHVLVPWPNSPGYAHYCRQTTPVSGLGVRAGVGVVYRGIFFHGHGGPNGLWWITKWGAGWGPDLLTARRATNLFLNEDCHFDITRYGPEIKGTNCKGEMGTASLQFSFWLLLWVTLSLWHSRLLS